MKYPFTKPVPCKIFCTEADINYHSTRRMVRAGIIKTVAFPSGERIPAATANRIIEHGLTETERLVLKKYIAASKKQNAA